MEYVILIIVFIVVVFFLLLKSTGDSHASEISEIERRFKERAIAREAELTAEVRKREEALQQYPEQRKRAFLALVDQARQLEIELRNGMLKGRNWLAAAFAEFVDTRNLEAQCWLTIKPSTANKAAEQVAEIRTKYRELAQHAKFLEYQVASYEEYFPAIAEYRDAILDEVVDLREHAFQTLEDAEPALSNGYLSRDEYTALAPAEKFQLALDRYWSRPKKPWQIGRMYERFIGALYERDGWRVAYHGIMKGLEDFGRDLICERGDEVHVIQCKCWSKERTVREKHIFQLFGTTVLFQLGLCDPESAGKGGSCPSSPAIKKVTPVFATTTELSPEAHAVAERLNITVRRESLQRYPMVKCNINSATREHIYHLPFDQQYDSVVIGNVPGEFYANTVAEAESRGYRRALRWRGNQ